jgi:hypothetical protein
MFSNDKLNKALEIYESCQPNQGLGDIIARIKNHIRSKFGKLFSKVVFDKTENGNGTVFIKFSSFPFEGATNEQLANAKISFMIAIEGFDANGEYDEDSMFNVEMFRFNNPENTIKKLRRKKFYRPTDASNYVTRYFDMNEEAMVAGGDVGIGTSGDISTSGQTSTPNVAVRKEAGFPKEKKKIVKRNIPKIRRTTEAKKKPSNNQ